MESVKVLMTVKKALNRQKAEIGTQNSTKSKEPAFQSPSFLALPKVNLQGVSLGTVLVRGKQPQASSQ